MSLDSSPRIHIVYSAYCRLRQLDLSQFPLPNRDPPARRCSQSHAPRHLGRTTGMRKSTQRLSGCRIFSQFAMIYLPPIKFYMPSSRNAAPKSTRKTTYCREQSNHSSQRPQPPTIHSPRPSATFPLRPNGLLHGSSTSGHSPSCSTGIT